MTHVQQRKKITTTLSPETYKRLEEIKKKAGFTSINQAIDFVVLNDSIKKQLELIFNALEELRTHVTRIQGGEKEIEGPGSYGPSAIPGVFKASELKVVREEPA